MLWQVTNTNTIIDNIASMSYWNPPRRLPILRANQLTITLQSMRRVSHNQRLSTTIPSPSSRPLLLPLITSLCKLNKKRIGNDLSEISTDRIHIACKYLGSLRLVSREVSKEIWTVWIHNKFHICRPCFESYDTKLGGLEIALFYIIISAFK